jgi:hypothetical protein
MRRGRLASGKEDSQERRSPAPEETEAILPWSVHAHFLAPKKKYLSAFFFFPFPFLRALPLFFVLVYLRNIFRKVELFSHS